MTRAILLALLLLGGPRSASADAINAVVGDVSWIAAHGRTPTAADELREVERVSTHLAWVEAELRRAEVSHLSPEAKSRRAALLDALAEYRGRARFPRNERYPGRRPRFADDEGNVCAVGHLIEVSAGRALTEAIDARFEYDHLLDMRDDRLAAWIASSGLTALELAMIQPGYGGMRPLPERSAPPPEPPDWTEAELTALLARAATAIEPCAAPSTRTIRVTVRTDRRRGTRVTASPRAVAPCAEDVVRRAMAESRFVAPAQTLSVTRTYRLRLPPEARAREEAARALDTLRPAFARCMPAVSPGRRAVLRVRVDEAGQLSLIEARVPVDPRSTGPRSLGADVWPPYTRACFTRLIGAQRVEAPPHEVTLVHRLPWGGSANLMDVAELGGPVGIGTAR